ncbi:MAG: Ig-like domain-containing domain [Candidatus Dormibacteria bacterium]
MTPFWGVARRVSRPSLYNRGRLVGCGLLASLVAVFVAGCGPLSPPQITDVLPPPSQGGVHTNAPIEIIFNVPMNEHSVETRLSLRNRRGRPAPGCDLRRAAAGEATGCRFSWSDGGRIMRLIHPGHPLATVTTYRVNLGGGIASRQGAVNSLSHSWAFSTEGGPSLSSTYPANHGVLGPDQAVAINFNRAMDQASVGHAVTITPVPPGGYSLSANPKVPGRFLLNPVRPLAPGTTYTLTVTRAALDTDGNHLQAGTRVKFTVGKLGSTPTIDFAAGATPTSYTEVLAASLPEVPGDPPSVRLLATAPAGQHYVFAWGSPNGQYLATELAGKAEIQVADLATGKTAAVLGSTASTAAVWSPNSQQLAFLAGGALRVYTVASKISVTLSAPAALGGPLAWRPDSSVLAAVATPSGTASRIALLSPSLRAVTYLGTSSAGPEGDPVWNQQGTGLAFSVGASPALAVWLYQPADVVAPLRLLRRGGGQPVAFLSSGSILVRTVSGSLEALSPTTEQVSQVVGEVGGQYPIATAVDDPGRVLAFTRDQGGFVNLFLSNQAGSGTAPLTAFNKSLPMNAGPPTFVGT